MAAGRRGVRNNTSAWLSSATAARSLAEQLAYKVGAAGPYPHVQVLHFTPQYRVYSLVTQPEAYGSCLPWVL